MKYEDVSYTLAAELLERLDDDTIEKLAIESMNKHDAKAIVLKRLVEASMVEPQDVITRVSEFGCVEPEHRAISELVPAMWAQLQHQTIPNSFYRWVANKTCSRTGE